MTQATTPARQGHAPPGARVDVQRRLSGADLDEVATLIDAATTADGVRPLNEHVMLHLRHGGEEDTRNLLARDADGALVGYAHLDITDAVAGPSAELVGWSRPGSDCPILSGSAASQFPRSASTVDSTGWSGDHAQGRHTDGYGHLSLPA